MPTGTDDKSFSTTVRLTQADAVLVDAFVEAGFFPSRSRLVFEAIRDLYSAMQKDLRAFYGKFSEDDPLLLVQTVTSDALKELYLKRTGFADRAPGKPSVTVNLKGNPFLLRVAISFIKDRLGIPDLFTVVSLALFLKLGEVSDVKAAVEHNTEFQKALARKDLEALSDDMLQSLLSEHDANSRPKSSKRGSPGRNGKRELIWSGAAPPPPGLLTMRSCASSTLPSTAEPGRKRTVTGGIMAPLSSDLTAVTVAITTTPSPTAAPDDHADGAEGLFSLRAGQPMVCNGQVP